MWLLFVYSCECCPGCFSHTQMVDTLTLRPECITDISETFEPGELSDCHGKELAPAVIRTKFLSVVVNFCQVFKIMSGKNCSQLVKDCVIVCHGSDLLVLVNVFRKFIITQRDTRAFIYLVLFVNL